jgi:hypothetical protein
MKDPMDYVRLPKPAPGTVRMAVITDNPAGGVTCNCGWRKLHPRKSVRENAAQRHLDKKHFGQGMWL